ncbi:MAG: FapA family protein [Spirochaetaceae bacterium]|jgi:uncharacterized protein (DUF342 family)|nr:FapA family protein [Spirochaetaceae bacterium]
MTRSSGKTTLSSNKHDARILLDFTEDEMEVYGDFLPPTTAGFPLSKEYVNTLLEHFKIDYGICWDHIEKAIKECTETNRPVRKVLIARGDIPVDETAGHFCLEQNVRKPAPPRFEDSDKTNYRAFSPFIVVQAKQVLAVLRPAVAGIAGKTVRGNAVPFNKMPVTPVRGGKNTSTDARHIYADVTGHLIINKNVLDVEPVLTVRGAVGYATGDINFPGDVTLEGPVNDGFKVQVGGSLNVRETLDATDIIVQKDVIIKGGMIGRGRALVKVSGALNARFIRNCRLACKKTVTINTEVINSTIYTMENVVVSEKGTILGGEVFAFHSLSAGYIGKDNTTPVKIHLGSDWTLRQEIENNENLMRLLTAKMEKIASYLSSENLDAAKFQKIEEVRTRLTGELSKCRSKKAEFEKRSVVDTKAMLVCAGQIAAGTVVEICGVEFLVEEPLRRIRLALDSTSGSIAGVPL